MNSLKSLGKWLLSVAWLKSDYKLGQTEYFIKSSRTLRFLLIWGIGMHFTITVIASPDQLVSRYSIHLSGASIGEFYVKQTDEKGNLTIEAITDVNINLLFSYRIKYVQNTVYNNGILQSSHVVTYKNGKLNSNVWLKLQNNSYLLTADGDTTIINDLITYSGSLIYFNEPAGINKIYKERSAETMCISPACGNEYIVKDKKGREINRYYYENGTLLSARTKHPLGTIEFKQIDTN